jgi:hypothetical protein
MKEVSMYRSTEKAVFPCLAILISLLCACGPLDSPPSGPETGARIAVSFPFVSPSILGAIDAAHGAGRSMERPRPFFRATRIVIRLLDMDGVPVDSVDLFPDSNFRQSACANFAVAPGSYRLEADIYNSYRPADAHVSSGSSAIFSVARGQTASVSFACLPVDPTPLAEGEESQAIKLVPYIQDRISQIVDYREELWFSYTASGITLLTATPQDPACTGYCLAVFDSQGNFLGSFDGSEVTTPDGSLSMVFGLNQGERYFIGCVSFGVYGGQSWPTVRPAVFTISARPALIAGISLSAGSGNLFSGSIDSRSSAATLIGGSVLSVAATTSYPGDALYVDGVPASSGTPVAVEIGAEKRFVEVVAEDPRGIADVRRVWISRATPLAEGQPCVGTTVRGEELYFYMPVDPGAAYNAEWTEGNDDSGFPIYATYSASDEDGHSYFADMYAPQAMGFTTTGSASCLFIRANPNFRGMGGSFRIAVTKL